MSPSEAQNGYRMPPVEIADLVDAPPPPAVGLGPGLDYLLLMARPSLPPISEVARPEHRLAGLRIDPGTNGPSRQEYHTGLSFVRISDGVEQAVTGLPAGARIGAARWSPDGARFAFAVTEEDGIALWVAGVETREARQLMGPGLNAVLGPPFVWMPDGRTLICRTVRAGRGEAPVAPTVPEGPVIQENLGKVAPSRTYQDLLRNAYDEELFEHYGASQVVRVTVDGRVDALGPVGMVGHVSPAPGGAYLLVETVHRPFSHLVPCYRFPRCVEVWDGHGQVVRQMVDLPLAEEVPVAFDAVPEGPRSFGWRADEPATLSWVEAKDKGDPGVEAQVRDRVYTLSAPFDGDPEVLASLELRYAGVSWGSGELALISERWWKTRRVRTWRLSPDAPGDKPAMLFDRSWEDRYKDPGSPLMRRTPEGVRVLLTGDGGRSLYLVGEGASPEGDRPFLDRLDVDTGQTERLWRSEAPYYERPLQLLGDGVRRILTSRESMQEAANYFVRDLAQGAVFQVTDFPDPAPQLRDVKKELIRYKRADGVELTATLYLPPGYSPDDGPLPMLMWAYPREYKSADAAGQVKDSPYRFVRVSWGSPLFWLTQGYAILDGPTMPIVGEGDEEANDTFVAQLAASAKAAVEEAVRRGVGDRNRMATGGHSYGGFMTANLLAHTNLFRAGIARSGAYNRTLTPFGFQAEERTLWEAPEVYSAMSPYMHADKIHAPLLLVHGEADNNSGTFPMQSERLYNALKGHGKTARLVMLPHESHGYRGRESVMHMLWEMTEWLERYVKRAQPQEQSHQT